MRKSTSKTAILSWVLMLCLLTLGMAQSKRKANVLKSTPLYDTLYSKDSQFVFKVNDDSIHSPVVDKENRVVFNYVSEEKGIALFLDRLTPQQIKESIERTGTIQDAFIDILDLSQIPNFKGDSLYLYNCFIRFVKADLILKKRLVFNECSVERGFFKQNFSEIKIQNSDFKDASFMYAHIDSLTFNRNTLKQMEGILTNEVKQGKRNWHIYKFTFYGCIFKKSPMFGFTAFEKPQFIDCSFLRPVIFKKYTYKKEEAAQLMQIFREDQKKKRIVSNKYRDSSFQAQREGVFGREQSSTHNQGIISRFSFSNSIFNRGVTFEGIFEDCSFTNTEFNGLIDLTDARIQYANDIKSPFFSESYFDEDTLRLDIAAIQSEALSPLEDGAKFIEKNANFLLADSLKIRPIYLKDMVFELYYDDKLLDNNTIGQANHNRIGLFFGKLYRYVMTYGESIDSETLEEIKQNLEYQHQQYHRYFYYHRTFKERKIGYLFPWLWASIKELTVRNGYKGALRFFSISISLIVLFALIFYQWFSAPTVADQLGRIGNVLESGNEMKKRMAEIKEEKNRWNFFEKDKLLGRHRLQNIGACMVQSFELFIFPKFPMRYFNDPSIRGALLILIIFEWALGLFMMGLFTYFIATKYAFVTKLLGI